MAKRKAQTEAAPVEVEPAADPAPADEGEPAAAAGPATGDGKISKMEAVRRTLAEGVESPTDGVSFIKERFGLEVNASMFGAYKSQLKAKERAGVGQGKPGRKPGNKPGRKPGAAGAKPGPQPGAVAAPAAGNPLEAARQVKELVERYGAETVKGLADMFEGK